MLDRESVFGCYAKEISCVGFRNVINLDANFGVGESSGWDLALWSEWCVGVPKVARIEPHHWLCVLT
jgi:hypothetical protein